MTRSGLMTWLQRGIVLTMAVVLFAGPLVTPRTAHAQFFNEDPDSDFFGENDDEFFDAGTDEFGEPIPGGGEQDFSEGDQYVDESSQQGPITVGGRQVQLKLASERDVWLQNASWGAGTGLLIGGWFALINSGNNRDTQRSIGVGVVAGAILGAVVGIRYVINPDNAALGDNSPAPKPESDSSKVQWQPMVSLDPQAPSLGVRLLF